MELSTIIKLRNNYFLFQEGSTMCVYDKEANLVKLKFSCAKAIDTYALNKELMMPHTLHWLQLQSYWSWLGVLVNRYHDLFEILISRDLKRERARLELSEIIARESYAENAEVLMDFSESTLVLYGLSRTNVAIAEAVSDMNYRNIIFINREELAEAEDIEDETGIYKDQDLLKSKKEILQRYYGQKRREITILDLGDIKELVKMDKCFFVIENNELSKEELLSMNQFVTEHRKVAIFFQMQQEQLVFGPLVIGGESTCLECLEHNGLFEQYFGRKSVPVDSVFRYMLLFLIKRTLCYVKEDDLFILLGDVQIPMNKIFKINRLTMRGEFDYIYRDAECNCTIAV